MTEKNNKKNSYVGYGVAFGLPGGALFSIIVSMFIKSPLTWAFGPGLGLLIGIVTGTIMDSTKGKK